VTSDVDVLGTLEASSGVVDVAGRLSGTGTLAAAAGKILKAAGGGTFSGLFSGAGTVELISALTLNAGAGLAAAVTIDTQNVTLGAAVALTVAAGDLFELTSAHGKTNALGGAGTASFTNDGTLIANGAGSDALKVAFTDAGLVSVTAGTLSIGGSLSGAGTLNVGAGATLALAGGGDFSGALTGAGTVTITKAMTLGLGVSLGAATVMDSTSVTLGTGTALAVSAGDTFSITTGTVAQTLVGGTGATFSNYGTIAASGTGTFTVHTAFANTGVVSVGSGTLSFIAGVANSGLMNDMAGALSVIGLVTGTGTLDIGATGTLSLLSGVEFGQTVDFTAGTGLFDLGKASAFAGAIAGFGSGDVIDLLKIAETGFTFSNGVLAVTNGATTECRLAFAGNYTSNSFSLGTDGHAGSFITFV
jgi:hypothetical protein